MKSLLLVALACVSFSTFAIDCENAQSQMEMNQCAHQEFLAEDAYLQVNLQKLLSGSELDDASKVLLNKAHKAFVEHRQSYCRLEADVVARGGSMEPMIESGCAARLTQEQNKKLLNLVVSF